MNHIQRLAILGLGLVGIRHVEAAKNLPNVEFVAAVDPNEAGQTAARQYQIPWFKTIEELFDKAQFHGLIVATTYIPTRQSSDFRRS